MHCDANCRDGDTLGIMGMIMVMKGMEKGIRGNIDNVSTHMTGIKTSHYDKSLHMCVLPESCCSYKACLPSSDVTAPAAPYHIGIEA
jgi:hypothetical protein